MNVIYGHKWRSLFPDENSLRIGHAIWAQKLGGLTKKQLRRGVEACAYLSDWNPSVSEFVRAACGLPSLNQCVSRVSMRNNVDPVSYLIASRIGDYSLKNMSYDQQRKAIASHYEDCYAEVLSKVVGLDEDLTERTGIERVTPENEDQDEIASPELIDQSIAQIRSVVGFAK